MSDLKHSPSVAVDAIVRGDLTAIHIVVKYGYSGSNKYGWWAKCHWQDNKFCEPKTVEGNIRTRYAETTITEAIDAVLEVVNSFGLKLNKEFSLFYEGDEENTEYPPPEGWKLILQREAGNRHWRTYRP